MEDTNKIWMYEIIKSKWWYIIQSKKPTDTKSIVEWIFYLVTLIIIIPILYFCVGEMMYLALLY